MKVVLEFENCKGCPFFKTGNYWSSDGWDRMEDWICCHPEVGEKKIAGSVEWHEEKKIKVPEWCPIALKTRGKK
jgi:hypothetical protein